MDNYPVTQKKKKRIDTYPVTQKKKKKKTVTATQLAKLPPSKSYNLPNIIVQHQASKPSQTHFAITSTSLVPHATEPPTSSGQSMQRLFFFWWGSYSLHLWNTHVAKEPQGQCFFFFFFFFFGFRIVVHSLQAKEPFFFFFFFGWESYSLHLWNTHVAKEPQESLWDTRRTWGTQEQRPRLHAIGVQSTANNPHVGPSKAFWRPAKNRWSCHARCKSLLRKHAWTSQDNHRKAQSHP